MKSFALERVHYFRSGVCVAKIHELSDEEGNKYFIYGVDRITRQEIIDIESYPRNLLHAKARVVESIIREEAQPFVQNVFGSNPYELMRGLGKENLPLLIGFFQDPDTTHVFEEVLKGA